MGCPPQVRSKLSAVEGVESVDVDYKAKTAKVHVSEDADVDADALIAALEGSKFGASVHE